MHVAIPSQILLFDDTLFFFKLNHCVLLESSNDKRTVRTRAQTKTTENKGHLNAHGGGGGWVGEREVLLAICSARTADKVVLFVFGCMTAGGE